MVRLFKKIVPLEQKKLIKLKITQKYLPEITAVIMVAQWNAINVLRTVNFPAI